MNEKGFTPIVMLSPVSRVLRTRAALYQRVFQKDQSNRSGFTLVELLVVISILMTMLALGMSRYNAFNRRERVKQAALTLKATLRLALTKAISSQKPTSGCTTYLGVRVSFTTGTYQTENECEPEGVILTADCALPDTRDCVILPTGITFLPVPASFTFLTRSNTVNIDNAETLTLTNGIESYSLSITPSGSVDDIGF